MTKAERRELQERQRAAKLAQKSQKQGGGGPGKVQPGSGQHKKGPSGYDLVSTGKHPGPASGVATGAGGGAGSGHQGDDNALSKSRGLKIFSHFGLPKTVGHAVKGDIHPAVVRLALMFSEFEICGANARCIATLTAFKSVIQDYTTPENNTLSRHLMTHLSPQISYLVSARPMSVSMGNAIRQLKLEISGSDIDMVEQDAKDELCEKIDTYIRERILLADEVIQDLAGQKIKDGDVILTYARSSVVEKVLLNAHEEGKIFSVIVVDSRPLLEGKGLLRTLTSTNPPIPCTYTLLPALASVITEVTTVLVGAHSICANGAVYSRAGTALVAMLASNYTVPVVVCCETYKFSDSIVLDAFGKNELGAFLCFREGLFEISCWLTFMLPFTILAPAKIEHRRNDSAEPKSNLEILNPLYDLTPPTCITVVVTEVGLIPPSSISSIPAAMGRTLV
ncbi:hypothetical protein AMATHDRAFT_76237 [Amanita thiersii Skay4041]|uniref:Translation initiation factor eIF2B subunit delta n=1 Tax=Amanita thiersii Skay4041 TaxID=703135 RepID=A0A2A9NNU7_9AGAR|nr:hypothetical protein AMATHDRAFT_76237 [Amanita thiersii Skay4041]